MVPFTVTIDDNGQPSLLTISKAAFGRVMRATNYAVARYWDRNYVASHFKVQARGRYGYQPRTKRYEQKKRALARAGIVKKQGRVDLVFTGTAERVASRPHAIRAFPNRASVRLATPSYISMRQRRKGPKLGAELLMTTAQEREKLEEVALAENTKQFQTAIKQKRRRRI